MPRSSQPRRREARDQSNGTLQVFLTGALAARARPQGRSRRGKRDTNGNTTNTFFVLMNFYKSITKSEAHHF